MSDKDNPGTCNGLYVNYSAMEKKKVEELKRKAREAPRSDSHRPGVIRDDEDGRDVAIVSFDELGPIEVRPERGSNWAREKHPDRVSATYNREKGVRHLLAAYDLVRDRMYAHVKMHKTNVEFPSLSSNT